MGGWLQHVQVFDGDGPWHADRAALYKIILGRVAVIRVLVFLEGGAQRERLNAGLLPMLSRCCIYRVCSFMATSAECDQVVFEVAA